MLQRPIEPDYITECEDWHNVTLTIHGCGRRTLSAPGAAAYRFEGTLMLAYLAQGSGVLSSANKEFLVAEGQGFLVPPKLDYTFRADEDETCVLYWVEFFGSYVEKYLMRARLMADTPIFCRQSEILASLPRLAAAMAVMPIIAFIGVRISWDIREIKSDFARLASRASTSASCKARLLRSSSRRV